MPPSPIPDNIVNKQLYQQVKDLANTKYKRNGLYKSAYIQKEYGARGGTYTDAKPSQNVGINRWLKKEKWVSVIDYLVSGKEIQCGSQQGRMIPCRPMIRASPQTPITLPELVRKFGRDRVLSLARQKEANPQKRVNWSAGTIS
jgi:hypothetical protein